ncbi:hypothetical protein BGZ88_001062 [Linnemannia elongata]|nr:hypothetical protein BGZ88_001062 [Linnemannia elongata]
MFSKCKVILFVATFAILGLTLPTCAVPVDTNPAAPAAGGILFKRQHPDCFNDRCSNVCISKGHLGGHCTVICDLGMSFIEEEAFP